MMKWALPFMNCHLSELLLCLGNKFAADRSSQKALLDTDQLCHPLHRRRQLLPQAKELIPVYGGPLSVQWGDLKFITWDLICLSFFFANYTKVVLKINKQGSWLGHSTRYRMCKSFSSTKPFIARWRSAKIPRASGGDREEERVAAPSCVGQYRSSGNAEASDNVQ